MVCGYVLGVEMNRSNAERGRLDGEPPSLCRLAAEGVRRGRYDGAHFRLFNKAEDDEVRCIMAAHYPDVPFTTDYYAFKSNGS